ncbi:MAG TPA: hypothetical protein PKU91_06010 [Phycisphaerales bacterium]|nr:hypothetical protein [Phycisphaerae bacterium]HRJ50065.1 hypothetical protein [Phycisphaerales bacterium]
MTKMDMIWCATASLIHPAMGCVRTVPLDAILAKVASLYGDDLKITPVMVTHHLVSWQDRQADQSHPDRGGSRNRYLFRTVDGRTPAPNGDFRLSKSIDHQYDGWDKNGPASPRHDVLNEDARGFVKWFRDQYFHCKDD